MEHAIYSFPQFTFKTVQANHLYSKLMGLANEFKKTEKGLELENSLDGVYARSHVAQRYQDMVANAFEKAMELELSILSHEADIKLRVWEAWKDYNDEH